MPTYISNKKLYTTKEAADLIGRSRDTVLRWIRLKLFHDVSRDKNDHRVWTDDDITAIRKIKDELDKKKMLRGVR